MLRCSMGDGVWEDFLSAGRFTPAAAGDIAAGKMLVAKDETEWRLPVLLKRDSALVLGKVGSASEVGSPTM